MFEQPILFSLFVESFLLAFVFFLRCRKIDRRGIKLLQTMRIFLPYDYRYRLNKLVQNNSRVSITNEISK